MKRYDLVGKKFNYWTVISKNGHFYNKLNQKKGPMWECICECGTKKIINTTHLVRNISKSCGCQSFSGIHGNRKYEPKEASFRAKASNYKSHAKIRTLKWDITLEEAVSLLKQNCYYCGADPSCKYNLAIANRRKCQGKNFMLAHKEKYEIMYNGIDRVDNALGYIKDNIVPCCTICNFGKRTWSYDVFMAWLNQLVKYRNSLK